MGQEPPDLLLPGAALILGLIVTLVLLLVRMRRGGGKGAPNIVVCLVPLAIGVLAAVALYWLPPVADGARAGRAVGNGRAAHAGVGGDGFGRRDAGAHGGTHRRTGRRSRRRRHTPGRSISARRANTRSRVASDTLSVIIDRHWTDKPMTYFVAHIRMLDPNLFRAGFSNATNNGGTPKGMPWEVARRNNAVLLLMGDNPDPPGEGGQGRHDPQLDGSTMREPHPTPWRSIPT